MFEISEIFSKTNKRLIILLRKFQGGQLMTQDFQFIWNVLKDAPTNMITPSHLESLKKFEDELIVSECIQEADPLCHKYLLLVSNSIQERWRNAFRISFFVELCKGHFCQIQTCHSSEIVTTSLQTIFSLVQELKKSNQEITFSKSSAITLCLHQIKSSLPLLVDACRHDSAYIIKYVVNCLSNCLDCIAKEICEHSELPCSEFLDLMDCVLSTLQDGRPSKSQILEIQEQVDELLCHAMATAQVTVTEEDRERIKSKSHVVLKGLKSLSESLDEDLKEVNLLGNVLSDALCDMERSVNNAVLRLVLEVCSGVEDPLRKLVDRCKPDSVAPLTNRQSSDLENDIVDFDVFMDRLIQVGTFAVSCSSNVRKAMQLRSCLATFESLEAEVVPCVTALYLDGSKANKVTVRLLLERWHNEINLYQELLASIVDPSAYVHVVLNYLKDQRKLLEDSDGRLTTISNMTKAVKSLHPVLLTTFKQDSLEDSSIIKAHSEKINKVAKKCLKLVEEPETEKTNLQREALLMKASDLIEEVECLWESLARQLLDNETTLNTTGIKLETNCAKDYYKLCASEANGSDLALLTPIAVRSLKIVKEAAVLYNTPKRSTVKQSAMKTPAPRSTIRKKVAPSTVRSRCFRTPANITHPNIESMELTQLLDDLTKLDDTFTDSTVLHSQKDPLCGKQLLQLFEQWDMSVISQEGTNSTAAGVDSRSVSSFERMKDLEMVQDKIEALKAADEYVTVINIP